MTDAKGAPPPLELLERLKSFLGFVDADAATLKTLLPLVEKHGAGITARFYDLLGRTPETARHIQGRVDQLKKTHQEWMRSLVSGEYGAAYLESRWRIGQAHVRVGLDPYWVEAIMSFIRTEVLAAASQEATNAVDLATKHRSFCKACDLDLLVINLSYAEDRLDRITDFTGMKRALVENIIRIPRK